MCPVDDGEEIYIPPRSRWSWLYWWPVRRRDQKLFAEALSQALGAGFDICTAVRVAAGAMPSRRFRAALHEMAVDVRTCWSADARTGTSLARAIKNTGISVSRELVAALAVGQERGNLPESLAAFARQGDPRIGAKLATAVGRRPQVTRFAAALARLLKDHRLTVSLLNDAAKLAAGEGSSFANTVKRVVTAMQEGTPFAEAITREKRTFDPLFCTLVGGTDTRDRLRIVLTRFGEAALD